MVISPENDKENKIKEIRLKSRQIETRLLIVICNEHKQIETLKYNWLVQGDGASGKEIIE